MKPVSVTHWHVCLAFACFVVKLEHDLARIVLNDNCLDTGVLNVAGSSHHVDLGLIFI